MDEEVRTAISKDHAELREANIERIVQDSSERKAEILFNAAEGDQNVRGRV